MFICMPSYFYNIKNQDFTKRQINCEKRNGAFFLIPIPETFVAHAAMTDKKLEKGFELLNNIIVMKKKLHHNNLTNREFIFLL